jgi:hypothetical protein
MIKRYNILIYEVYWIWEYVHLGVYKMSHIYAFVYLFYKNATQLY